MIENTDNMTKRIIITDSSDDEKLADERNTVIVVFGSWFQGLEDCIWQFMESKRRKKIDNA